MPKAPTAASQAGAAGRRDIEPADDADRVARPPGPAQTTAARRGKPAPSDRPVMHPTIRVRICSGAAADVPPVETPSQAIVLLTGLGWTSELIAPIPEPHLVLIARWELSRNRPEACLVAADAKKYLGWEDEDAYRARMSQGMTPAEAAARNYGYDDEYDFKDMNGAKVKCWNNCRNRPLREAGARQYAQDVLTCNWRFNCEPIIISRKGVVTSGQHRLIGLVFAWQLWFGKEKERWRKFWSSQPEMPTIVILGGSDDPRVIATVDNVIPRSESDVIYTSEVFRNLDHPQRRTAARTLSDALDLVWRRTQATGSGGIKYRTHSAAMDFLSRHKRLQDCVLHIVNENRDLRFSEDGLVPGHLAGLMYLMAVSRSNPTQYLAAKSAIDRTERRLEFKTPVHPARIDAPMTSWDAAKTFMSLLAAGDRSVAAIHEEMERLWNERGDAGVSRMEKIGIVCAAWNAWSTGKVPRPGDLRLTYAVKDGKQVIAEHPNVGGIDAGMEPIEEEVDGEDPAPDEIRSGADRERKEAEAERRLKTAEKLLKDRERRQGASEQYRRIKNEWPEHILMLKTQHGSWACWGPDADVINRIMNITAVAHPDAQARAFLPARELEPAVAALNDEGHRVALAEEITEEGDDGRPRRRVEVVPREPARPAAVESAE